MFVVRMEASAKDGEGAGRGPCGLRNSELGPRPHNVLFASKRQPFGGEPILQPHSASFAGVLAFDFVEQRL